MVYRVSKIQNGLPLWCWLTQVVLEKKSINARVCVCMCVGRQGSLALAGSLSRRRKTLIQNRGLRSLLAFSGTSVTLSM